jgi:predicted ATPase
LDDLRTYGASGPVCIEFLASPSDAKPGTVKWGFGIDSAKSENRDLIVSQIDWPKGIENNPESVYVGEPTSSQPISASGTIFAGLVEPPRDLSHRMFSRLNSQQWREQPGNTETQVELLGLALNSARHPGGTGLTLNVPVLNEIRQILQKLTYLRATRIRPTRAYKESNVGSRQVIGYDGQGTARHLNERGNESLVLMLPPAIPESLGEVADLINRSWEERSTTLLQAVRIWLHRFRLADSIEAIQSKDDRSIHQVHVTLPGQREHDITEVGFGVSQVLPVLVAGLIQPKDSLFIVDLPEAHLHPKPQAELADFFCALALSDRSVLVETHSEMFINQLRLRAEVTPGLMEKIAVYFIDSPIDGFCCQPRRVEFGVEGEMRWPVGFMQEALDIETMISAVRAAKRRSAR